VSARAPPLRFGSVACYFIYALTVGGTIYAYRKGTIPGRRAGDFSLGRWFVPVAVLALAYVAGVIVIALAPHEGHTAAAYLLGAEVVGLLWYLLYLRARIASRSAGVLRQEVAELEKSARTSSHQWLPQRPVNRRLSHRD